MRWLLWLLLACSLPAQVRFGGLPSPLGPAIVSVYFKSQGPLISVSKSGPSVELHMVALLWCQTPPRGQQTWELESEPPGFGLPRQPIDPRPPNLMVILEPRHPLLNGPSVSHTVYELISSADFAVAIFTLH